MVAVVKFDPCMWHSKLVVGHGVWARWDMETDPWYMESGTWLACSTLTLPRNIASDTDMTWIAFCFVRIYFGSEIDFEIEFYDENENSFWVEEIGFTWILRHSIRENFLFSAIQQRQQSFLIFKGHNDDNHKLKAFFILDSLAIFTWLC